MEKFQNSKKLSPKNEIIQYFYQTGVLQFGKFELKGGSESPYYFDLRRIISNPDAFGAFGEYLANFVRNNIDKPKKGDPIDYQHIAGVPFGGIPIAVQLGNNLKKSILMPRPSAKKYGNKKEIEGVFEIGDEVILIEDTVTTGGSCMETIKMLERNGCIVSAVLIIMDREEGGLETIEQAGYEVFTLFDMVNVIENLKNILQLIDEYKAEAVLHYVNVSKKRYVRSLTKELIDKGIEGGEVGGGSGVHGEDLEVITQEIPSAIKDIVNSNLPDTLPDELLLKLEETQKKIKEEKSLAEEESKKTGKKVKNVEEKHNYKVYSPIMRHRLQVSLLDLIIKKKSALCLSLDLSKWEKGKELLDACGENIVMVKVHAELFEDFSDTFGKEIKELARKHKFFIMEDRKLADVDNITFRQMMGGYMKIDEWASFVTIHGLTLRSSIDYYDRRWQGKYPLNVAPCVVLQMNAANNMITKEYTDSCIEVLNDYKIASPIVICQNLPEVNDRIKATPGVILEGDDGENVEGRSYRSVEDAIIRDGNHIVIVGSAILFDSNPLEISKSFAEKSWTAFQECFPDLITECGEFMEELESYMKRRNNPTIVDDSIESLIIE